MKLKLLVRIEKITHILVISFSTTFFFIESPLDRKKSRDLKEENIEFGIELLNKSEHHGNAKAMQFEAINMHDRKLWLQKLKEATENYKEKADQEKAKKYSGTFCLTF